MIARNKGEGADTEEYRTSHMVERKARSVRIHQFGGPEVLRIEDAVAGTALRASTSEFM